MSRFFPRMASTHASPFPPSAPLAGSPAPHLVETNVTLAIDSSYSPTSAFHAPNGRLKGIHVSHSHTPTIKQVLGQLIRSINSTVLLQNCRFDAPENSPQVRT